VITRRILTEPGETALFFVDVPTSVVKRFIIMVREFDITIGGVIANGIILEDTFRTDESGFRAGKQEEQTHYLKVIQQDPGDLDCAHVNLYSREVSGLDSPKLVVNDMLPSSGTT
jgi:anion-transporting  ArsA/GET3 family ATPase